MFAPSFVGSWHLGILRAPSLPSPVMNHRQMQSFVTLAIVRLSPHHRLLTTCVGVCLLIRYPVSKGHPRLLRQCILRCLRTESNGPRCPFTQASETQSSLRPLPPWVPPPPRDLRSLKTKHIQVSYPMFLPSSSGRPLPLRKEVIQPHLPIRLPCYDFTPVIDPTLGGWLPGGLPHRLWVLSTPMV